MAGVLRIRNWDRWQSYRKDRGQPPWIKIHREVMRNPEWVELSDAQRGQLVAIWLLAADRDGVIPASPKTIQKLCYLDTEPNIQVFVDKGFIESDANVTPTRRQDDKPEEEAETEAETEKKQRERGARARQLPPDWIPSERHFEAGGDLGFSQAQVQDMAEDMRLWAKAKGEVKKDWDAAFSGWMRRERKNGRGTGPPKTRTQQATEQFLAEFSDGNDRQTRSGEVSGVVRGELPKPAT